MKDLFDNTLEQARQQWGETIKGDGGRCPCCDRFGKIYARAINRTMAKCLLWLIQESQDGKWVDVPNRAPRWLVRSNQLPTLRWWELVERMEPCEDERLKHSGMWRPTDLGREFARDEVTIPKKVFTYDGAPVGFSSYMTTISGCIGGFHYKEVMQEVMKTY